MSPREERWFWGCIAAQALGALLLLALLAWTSGCAVGVDADGEAGEAAARLNGTAACLARFHFPASTWHCADDTCVSEEGGMVVLDACEPATFRLGPGGARAAMGRRCDLLGDIEGYVHEREGEAVVRSTWGSGVCNLTTGEYR